MVLVPARRSDRVLILCFIAADILMVPLVFLFTFWLRTSVLGGALPPFHDTFHNYASTIPVVVLLWVCVFAFSGLYKPRRFGSYMGDLAQVLMALVKVAIALMAASYLVKRDYSRFILLLFMLLAVPASLAARALARSIGNLIAPARDKPRILVVGAGEIARNVIRSLRRLPGQTPELVGVLVAKEGEPGMEEVLGVPVLGDVGLMNELLRQSGVDEVFFAAPDLPRSRILSIISEESSGLVHFRLATDLFSVATTETDIDNVARVPIIEVGPGGLSLAQRTAKRFVDITLSLLLLLFALPLMLLITLLLALTTRGSPLFTQKRVGLRGKVFTLVKFRTMKPEAAEYEVAPLSPDDKRVTSIGRLLRRTSLDELPQLFNVLQGSMSLVGPRPEMPFIVEEYESWQRHRLNVKPGLTGLWQIMGRKDLPLHENIEYDFFYIRNQSLMLDFAIMLRTLSSIVLGRGAY